MSPGGLKVDDDKRDATNSRNNRLFSSSVNECGEARTGGDGVAGLSRGGQPVRIEQQLAGPVGVRHQSRRIGRPLRRRLCFELLLRRLLCRMVVVDLGSAVVLTVRQSDQVEVVGRPDALPPQPGGPRVLAASSAVRERQSLQRPARERRWLRYHRRAAAVGREAPAAGRYHPG